MSQSPNNFSNDKYTPEQLRERCDKLEAKVEKYEASHKAASDLFFGLGIRFLRLQTIEKTLRNLLRAIHKENDFPTEEMVAFLVAVIRRILWIGTMTFVFALIPHLLSLWQINLLRSQLREQATSNYIKLNRELLEILHEEICRDDDDTSISYATKCLPLQTWRIRRQAVFSLIALDRINGNKHSELTGARLDELSLVGIDFSDDYLEGAFLNKTLLVGANMSSIKGFQVNMSDAELDSASLKYAELDEAIAPGANFTKANLHKASLVLADFNGANFSNSKLRKAKLWGANLSGANFSGADLTDTVFVKPNEDTFMYHNVFVRDTVFGIDREIAHKMRRRACYSEETIWPKEFNPKEEGLVLCVDIEK